MRIEKAQFKETDPEDYRIVLMTDDFRCVEPVLEFSNYLISSGFSPNTVDSYTRHLKVYFEWLESNGLSYLEATPVIIGLYLQFLNGGIWESRKDEVAVTIDTDSETDKVEKRREKSASTVNKMMAAVSSFYTYRQDVIRELTSPCIKKAGRGSKKVYRGLLAHTGYLNRTENSVHRVKEPKKLRRRLTPKEIEQFRQGISSFRDKTIFDLLYISGIRISELIGLDLDDFSEPDPTDKVGCIYLIDRDKKNRNREGRKKTGERIVHIPMDLIFEIDEYVTQYRPYLKGCKRLFVAQKGPTKGRSLKRKSVEKMFREYSIRSGVPCMPHELRHTHISELKEAGFDAAYIAVRTGNRTAQDDYTHITEVSMRESMQRVWSISEKRDGGKE